MKNESLSSNSVMKMEEESKQKRGGSGVGDAIKMTWKAKMKIESQHEVLW